VGQGPRAHQARPDAWNGAPGAATAKAPAGV